MSALREERDDGIEEKARKPVGFGLTAGLDAGGETDRQRFQARRHLAAARKKSLAAFSEAALRAVK